MENNLKKNGYMYVKVLVSQSCPTLCNPMDYSCDPLGSSVHGIFQARIMEWVAIPFSRGFPDPWVKLRSPAFQADSLLSEPPYVWLICSLYIWNLLNTGNQLYSSKKKKKRKIGNREGKHWQVNNYSWSWASKATKELWISLQGSELKKFKYLRWYVFLYRVLKRPSINWWEKHKGRHLNQRWSLVKINQWLMSRIMRRIHLTLNVRREETSCLVGWWDI